MRLLERLAQRAKTDNRPFLFSQKDSVSVEQVLGVDVSHLTGIKPGEVVALIGDFDARSLAELIFLIDRKAIVVPLTHDTRTDHEYFFESALVDWVVEAGAAIRRVHGDSHPLLDGLAASANPGLVLFSTGTTGRPKAILHDLESFMRRFETPRPAFRTMAFLLFDHIGGLNTLLHTMFNAGVVITPSSRSIAEVLKSCDTHGVEVLPTTPTFLRMVLMSGAVPSQVPESLKIITYGTERMDQFTLDSLCDLLPGIDFRQTYGMSELGILRVKSRARNSLFMKIGGDGVKTRVVSGKLEIMSPSRMLGYLNADSPFDRDGWYKTGDIVEVDGDFIKIVGRESEVINVGGLKFMASEVERVALQHPSVALVSVSSRSNPVSGQHVELTVEPVSGILIDSQELRDFLVERLPSHMVPRRLVVENVSVSHRYKRS